MAHAETAADKEWPEKAHTAGNAGVMVVGRSALHGGLPAVLLGGRFYFKRKEYLYTDFGGGVNRKDKESPLLGAFRELAEELFAEDEETAKVTAQGISEAVRSELVGGRPFISGDYVMFVVTAEALVCSLDMDPGDSAIDRLFEHARFFDGHGKANPELSSVALISIGELLRSAASDGQTAALQTRHSGKVEARDGGPEVIKLRPVMVGRKGSISVLQKILEDFASSQHSGKTAAGASGYSAPAATAAASTDASSHNAPAASTRRWQKGASSTMDSFYRPEVASLPPAELWLRAPEVSALLQQRVVPKPGQKQKCGILPMVVSAHSGYGWLAEHGSRSLPPEWHAARSVSVEDMSSAHKLCRGFKFSD
ncbi:hypothetical protein AK812_SmicGene31060 [Symbiodinium microadriaticum]|uniref:Nudix hydrolase domain-containing protein n=1 Tax=Symbiodinium microadriaticum TaxID=2951 RepID=A0A1Q9CXS7_SYMMI|nr:hypothetical protein AK812_SmicGene31060 [Symbiodinium microadriaticum]